MRERPSVGTSTLQGGKSTVDHQQEGFRGSCPRCGARRVDRQIGLEMTLEEYVARLVDVFREVRRILRDEGVVFLNLGDAFGAGARKSQVPQTSTRGNMRDVPESSRVSGFAKQLLGIPWRVALALQADGWYLRSEIIWSKQNPMPESVRDRPTKSHEQVFLLTKRERYFYDADAVREPYREDSIARIARGRSNVHKWADGGPGNQTIARNLEKACSSPIGRNRRSVWTIASSPFRGSHFAVMPTRLAATCIRAGTSQRGCCPACGKPWRRIVECEGEIPQTDRRRKLVAKHVSVAIDGGSVRNHSSLGAGKGGDVPRPATRTTGWMPSCKCDAGEPVPCRVFDPFGGVGTTVLAASNLGRIGIATELGSKYLAIARRRLERPHARHVRLERADQPMPLFDRGSPCNFPGLHSEPNPRPMEGDR